MTAYEKVRLMRELRNWSQENMAERLNMSVNGYSKIERGETRLNLPRLEQIAKVLGVNIFDLMPSNDGNFICLINEGGESNQHFYHNANNLIAEIEKLKLIIEHKDELLAQQDRELTIMREMLELMKK